MTVAIGLVHLYDFVIIFLMPFVINNYLLLHGACMVLSLFTQTVWISDSWLPWSICHCVTVSERQELVTSEYDSEMLLGFEKVKAVCG